MLVNGTRSLGVVDGWHWLKSSGGGRQGDDVSNKAPPLYSLPPHRHKLVHGDESRPVPASRAEQWGLPVKGDLARLHTHTQRGLVLRL